MGDRIIQESKTISRKNLIKNLIDMCDVNIYKLEFIKLEIWLLQYAYGLTQEEAESSFKSPAYNPHIFGNEFSDTRA